MFKEMMIKGGAIVAAILVAEAALEKLEKRSLKRNKKSDVESKNEGDKTLDEKAKWAKLKPRVEETLKRHGKL